MFKHIKRLVTLVLNIWMMVKYLGLKWVGENDCTIDCLRGIVRQFHFTHFPFREYIAQGVTVQGFN